MTITLNRTFLWAFGVACMLALQLHGQDRLRAIDAEIESPIESSTQPKASRFVVSIQPLGVLHSSDADGFVAWSLGGSRERVEERVSIDSYMPTLHLGLGIDDGNTEMNLLLGGGGLANAGFTTSFLECMLSSRVHISPHVQVGGHFGLMQVADADYRGDADIDLEGGTGLRYGLGLYLGGGNSMFSVSLHYVDFAFDVVDSRTRLNLGPSMSYASATELDISGISLQLGAYLSF